MAMSDEEFCSLCKEEDTVNNIAYTWCTECVTFLCVDCDKHHSRNISSKQHKTIPLKDYKMLPDFVKKTRNYCSDHDQKYDLYCPYHLVPCCSHCVTEQHHNCKDLTRLSDTLKDMKSSTPVYRLEQDLRDTEGNYDNIVTDTKSRLAIILKQKTNGDEKIQQMLETVIKNFEKHAKQLLKELDELYNTQKLKKEKLIKQAETKRADIRKIQKDFAQMKSVATDLQTFFGLKEIECKLEEENDFLEKLKQSGDLETRNLTVVISPEINAAMQKVTCFGSISASSEPFTLKEKKELECQVPVIQIETIVLGFIQKIILPRKVCTNITDCQILPNGELLFLEKDGKQLIQSNNQGKDVKRIWQFKKSPSHICYIKDDTVAVTVPDSNQILRIGLMFKNLITTIQRGKGNDCYGIDSNGDTIYVLEMRDSESQITLLDPLGKELRQIKLDGFWEYFAVFESNIYCSIGRSNRVICLQDIGDKVWENASNDLKKPGCIAIDKNGLIYVACKDNGINIISPDGQRSRNVLSEGDGILNPTCISIDRNMQTILVCNIDGSALIFQLPL